MARVGRTSLAIDSGQVIEWRTDAQLLAEGLYAERYCT